MINRILIYDPVPFKGGSKEVMKTILAELPDGIEVYVISNDKESWHGCNVRFVSLFSPLCLMKKTTGIFYFIKHFIYLSSLFFNLCKLKRINKIVGISGPCVDFSLYLLTAIINIDIIQLIQGDIANSSVASFGLKRAKKIFYLPSTQASILKVLKRNTKSINIEKTKFIPFINDINASTIKEKTNNDKIGFFWAASLLKWKRIDIFIAAMAKLNTLPEHKNKYFASVCYIKPLTDAYLDIASYVEIDNIQWYADPINLNDIRASSSVFISTAEHEPFGLSILESMVAGLAIVIPAENAYWDKHLIDGYDCLKYSPNNMPSLVQALTQLIDNPALLVKISKQAKISAQYYSHLNCYSNILKYIPN